MNWVSLLLVVSSIGRFLSSFPSIHPFIYNFLPRKVKKGKKKNHAQIKGPKDATTPALHSFVPNKKICKTTTSSPTSNSPRGRSPRPKIPHTLPRLLPVPRPLHQLRKRRVPRISRHAVLPHARCAGGFEKGRGGHQDVDCFGGDFRGGTMGFGMGVCVGVGM